MKPRLSQKRDAAIMRKDVLIIIASIIIVVGMAALWVSKARFVSGSICCNCNLKQIGLAFRVWEGDHADQNPMFLSTNDGGVYEDFENGKVFRVFQIMSNELATPFILICPSDSRQAATNFTANFSNEKTSYFIGEVTNELHYEQFLSGDRNLTGGILRANGFREVVTNQTLGWNSELHKCSGNILLADGSVQETVSSNLTERLQQTGLATNRFAIP